MSSRKSVERSFVDRIPRPFLAGLFLLGCLLACSIGMAARRPFILAAETRAENDLLRRKFLEHKYATQQLEKRLAELQTPEGQEREARRHGYLKPEETRLTFLP